MTSATYLGLDIGTSGVKGVLVNERQYCLATPRLLITMLPRAGGAEPRTVVAGGVIRYRKPSRGMTTVAVSDCRDKCMA